MIYFIKNAKLKLRLDTDLETKMKITLIEEYKA